MNEFDWLRRAYLRVRYMILFYSLILTFVAAPLLRVLGLKLGLVRLLMVGNLLLAVVPIDNRHGRRLLMGILVAALAVQLESSWLRQGAISSGSLALGISVGLFAIAGALRYAMLAAEIDTEHVYAALSAYVLAGFVFGVCYWLLEQSWPGSLLMASARVDFSLPSTIYFSFVTLASLGYGDILPGTDVARGLAIFEAVGGQLFLVVMVARLVSLYAPRAAGKKQS
jgi:hypothetical protein